MNAPSEQVLVSSCYLGPVSYFAWLAKQENILLDRHEHYIKQTYRNRCVIATANGAFPLIIPVIKPNGNHTDMKDVRIAYSEKWQQLHWRTLLAAYSNSPFFLYYRDELEPFYQKPFPFLFDFNEQLLQLCFKWLRLKIQIRPTNNYILPNSDGIRDMRSMFHPKKSSPQILLKYTQVFDNQFGFIPDLSLLDLLFNTGPEAGELLAAVHID